MLKHLLFRYKWNRPGLDLLLWGGEFLRKLVTRSRQAVFVNTTEYINRRTLRISTYLFAVNPHCSLYPPIYAYVLDGKRNLPLSASAAGNLRFYPSVPRL